MFTCGNSNVTCSGTTKQAQYKMTGTNNQARLITAPNVTLTNQNDNIKTLQLTVDNPGFVDLGNSGTARLNFGLGGSIAVDLRDHRTAPIPGHSTSPSITDTWVEVETANRLSQPWLTENQPFRP